MHDPQVVAETILRDNGAMQLATCADEQPWIVTVWYAFDPEAWTLTFFSKQWRRHCQEILANPKVAMTVFASPPEGLGQEMRAVILEGECALATDTEAAYERYAQRWPFVREVFTPDEIAYDKVESRMFVVRVTRGSVFDGGAYPGDPHQDFTVR